MPFRFLFLFFVVVFGRFPLWAQQVNWVQRIGGSVIDRANAVATDSEGNVYVAGSFQTTLTLEGRSISSQNASTDAFFAKFNSLGRLQWLQSAGGPLEDAAIDLVWADGQLWAAGIYRASANFEAATLTSLANSNDIFLIRLDPLNGNIVNAYSAGGSLEETLGGLAFDANSQSLWLTGSFQGAARFHNLTLNSVANQDVFLVRFSLGAQTFDWAQSAGGGGIDQGRAIAIAPGGEVLVAGAFASSSFAWGSLNVSNAGNFDIFLAKLNPNTGNVDWLSASGSSQNDQAQGLALGPEGNLYLTGRFTGLGVRFNGVNSFALASSFAADNPDFFIAQYNLQGAIQWVRASNASGIDYGNALAADRSGVFIAGVYQGVGSLGAANLSSFSNSEDIFIAHYSPQGQPIFARIYGRQNNDGASDIVVSGSNLYVTGSFLGSNVDFGGITVSSAGVSDGFVLQHSLSALPCQGFSVAIVPASVTLNCGGELELSAGVREGTPPYRFLWSGPQGFSSSLSQIRVSNLRQSGTYSVWVTDANNCQFQASAQANVIPFTVTVSADKTELALGESARLRAVAGEPASFIWSPSQGLDNPTLANPVATPLSTTTYTVSATSALGCQASAALTLRVRGQEPCRVSALATPSRAVAGSSVRLSASVFPPDLNYLYAWSGPGGFRSSLASPVIDNIQVSGVYTVTVQGGGCLASASVSVTVTLADSGCQAPVLLRANTLEICPGDRAELSVTPEAGASYIWSRNNIPIAGASGPSYTTFEGGIFAVRVKRAGCAERVSNAVRIGLITAVDLPLPLTIPSGSVTLQPCQGEVDLSLAPSYPTPLGASFQWYLNGEAVDGATFPQWKAREAGVYHLEVIQGGQSPCPVRKKSEAIFVTRSEITPVYVEAGEDAFICQESSVRLLATAWAGSPWPDSRRLVFRWEPSNLILQQEDRRAVRRYSGDSLQTYGRDSSIVLVQPGVTTTFTVTVSDEYGCFSRATVTARVGSLPAPRLTPVERSVCSDQSVRLEAEGGVFQFYQWKRRPIGSSANTPFVSLGGNASFLLVSEPGEYVVEVSGPGCPIQRSNVSTVRVNLAPSVSLSDVSICQSSGGGATLSARASGVGLSYLWAGPGGPYGDAASITVPVSALALGSNGFSLTVVSSNGCQAQARANIIVFPPLPGSSFSVRALGETNICPGSSVNLSVPSNFINSLYSYQWLLEGSVIEGAVEPTFRASLSGVYSARISSGPCASALGSVSISYRSVPVVEAGSAGSICLGGSTRIQNASVRPSGSRYSWSPSIGLDNPGALNPIAAPLSSTTYTLTAVDPVSGCVGQDSVRVVIDPFLGPVAKASLVSGIVCAGQSDSLIYENQGSALGSENVFYRLDRLEEGGGAPLTVASGLLPSGRRLGYSTGPLNQTTWYILTLTDPDIACVSTCTLKAVVGPALQATVQSVLNESQTFNLCDGPITLRAISNVDARRASYQWVVYPEGDDGYVEIPGATGLAFSPKAGGRYSVIVRDWEVPTCFAIARNFVNLMGSTNQGALELITVETLGEGGQLEREVPTSSVAVCQGSCAKLRANYVFNASYQWYRNGQPLAGQNGRELLVCEPGQYQVQILSCASGFPCQECSGFSAICPVLVLPRPISPTVNHAGPVALCGDHVELFTQNQPFIYRYQWQRLSDTGYVDIAGATAYNFLTREAGRYRVLVSIRNRQYNVLGQGVEGCGGVSINEVRVSNGVELSLVSGDGNSVLCGGQSLLARVNSELLRGDYRSSWQWYYNDAPLGGATGPELTPRREGRYYAVLSYSQGGVLRTCRSPSFLAQGPRFNLSLPSTLDACPGQDSLVLRASLSGSLDNLNYLWEGIGVRSQGQIRGRTDRASLVVRTGDISFNDTLRYRLSVSDGLGCRQVREVALVFRRFSNPSNTRVAVVGSRSARIEWDPVEGVEYYLIQYKRFDEDENAWRPVSDYPWRGFSYLLQGLTPNTDYVWRVASACAANPSARASEWAQFSSFRTQAPGSDPCLEVSNPSFEVTDRQATIRFLGVNSPAARGYRVSYRLSGSLDWVALPELAQPMDLQTPLSVTVSDLVAQGLYDVRITTLCGNEATDANFLGAFSVEGGVSQAPLFQLPFPLRQEVRPIGTACPGNIQVDIGWSVVAGAVGYIFQYQVVGQEWRELTLSGNLVSNLNLVPNTDYAVRVKAVYDPPRPQAPWSEVRRFRTENDPTCVNSRLGLGLGKGFRLYPNPNAGNFSLSWESEQSGVAVIEAWDKKGQLVYQASHPVEAGEQVLPIRFAGDISQGIYYLRLRLGAQSYSFKVAVE